MIPSFEETFDYLLAARDKEKAANEVEFQKDILKLCEERKIPFEAFPKEEYDELWELTQNAEQRLDEIIYDEEGNPLFKLAQAINNHSDEDITNLRNRRYEANHTKITCCIYSHLRSYKAFPMIAVIVEVTGLSRQTVHKHLQSIKKESYAKRYQNNIEITRQMILEKLAGKYFGEDDLKSAALYLRFTEEKHVNIQLNNIILNKQVVNNLSEEQVKAIETIIIGEVE